MYQEAFPRVLHAGCSANINCCFFLIPLYVILDSVQILGFEALVRLIVIIEIQHFQ